SAALMCARCLAGRARLGAASPATTGWSWCGTDESRSTLMSILVELPERLYQPDAFAAFRPTAEFSLGTARAMAWMSQLAYESDPDKIRRICALWALRHPRPIANAASLSLPFIRTRGFVAEGHGATVFAFAGTDPLVPANWFTDFDVKLNPGAMV